MMRFKPKPKSKPKPKYIVAWACCSGMAHTQYLRNDGICFDCGETVREAVCKGFYSPYIGLFIPHDNGFVRWRYGSDT